MTISSLVLTDGTTTCTLTDGTNYALVEGGWAPAIADLRPGELGGAGPYEEVDEQIALDIFSVPAGLSTTLANVRKLQTLCQQARRWARGESVAAVRLQLTMTGSSMREAVVLAGDLQLPANFATLLVGQEIGNATLTLRRRGLWLSSSVTSSTTSTGVTGPTIATMTIADHPTLSPARLRINGLTNNGTVAAVPEGWVLTAPSSDYFQLLEGELFALSSFPSVASASGGTVASTASGGQNAAYLALATAFRTGLRRAAVYVAYQVEQATDTFDISCHFTYETLPVGVTTYAAPDISPPLTVSGSEGTTPRIAQLAMLSAPVDPRDFRLIINRTAGTGLLRIDYVFLARIDDERTSTVSFARQDTATRQSGNVITIDSRYGSHLAPIATITIGGVAIPISYLGDAVLMHSGTTVACAALWRDPGGTAWTYVTNTGSKQTYTFQLERFNAQLSPE